MEGKQLKKNIWASNPTQISPFGAFKSLFKEYKDNKSEITPETEGFLKEKELLERNSALNREKLASETFKLIDKYKDFLLENGMVDKIKSLLICNSLLEKGINLEEELGKEKGLKAYENKGNFILISYEIRKIFIELLKNFNNIDVKKDFLTLKAEKTPLIGLKSALQSHSSIINEINAYLNDLSLLIN